tara:strand:- start:345 stop:1706 length:1362 start_codon:yes stop_codon:yes gene_type:complete
MASTYLTRTPSSASNRRTFTISTWVKLANLDGNTTIFSAWYADSTVGHFVFRGSSDKFGWSQWSNDSYSTRVFRDVNGWYHVVLAVDTTQATASNRIKMYINGVQETSFSVGAVYPSQNEELPVNNNNIQTVGSNNYSSNQNFFDGSMSHFHLIDGTAYDATAFGSTDATTGEWKINTSPSVTYGTNGFFILKDGNSVTDQSPNTNNFSIGVGAGGGLSKTEDSPSNVFCTLNPLARYAANLNLSNGNNSVTETNNNWAISSSTLGASTGKFYYEYKITTTASSGNAYHQLGFISDESNGNSASHFSASGLDGGYSFYVNNGSLEVRIDNSVISGYDQSTLATSFTTNDIMCLAVDMTNKRVYFRKNGDAWIKSANPVNGTNGLDISANYTAGKTMIPAVAIYYGGVGSLNFGNGYFANNPVSSAGTNASGIGIFEYDVPTGYTALSTKGLNL